MLETIISAAIHSIIAGLVIQWFVKRWHQQHLNHRAEKFASLLTIEMQEHNNLFDLWQDTKLPKKANIFSTFKTDAWHQTQEFLSEYPQEIFERLATYYVFIEMANCRLKHTPDIFLADVIPLFSKAKQENQDLINNLKIPIYLPSFWEEFSDWLHLCIANIKQWINAKTKKKPYMPTGIKK